MIGLRISTEKKGGLGPPFVLMRFALGLGLGMVGGFAGAQPAGVVVYRCPGPPVLYTDTLTPDQARAQQCRSIEGAPLNAGAAPARSAARNSSPTPAASAAPQRSALSGVDAAQQAQREAQARHILQAELAREEDRLAALKQDFQQGQPERRSDEKNAAKYQERVESMRSAILRKEADIAALKREISLRTPR